jgi:hypothetical protein
MSQSTKPPKYSDLIHQHLGHPVESFLAERRLDHKGGSQFRVLPISSLSPATLEGPVLKWACNRVILVLPSSAFSNREPTLSNLLSFANSLTSGLWTGAALTNIAILSISNSPSSLTS